MIPDQESLHRLRFLARVARRASDHLAGTTGRLFTAPMTPARVRGMQTDEALAERVDAFVSRFGRLQDILGDKLLPAVLSGLGEPAAPVIDRLDRAERLGLIPSTERWMAVRQLRNQMVHDYVEDPIVLADALNTARNEVPMLSATAERLITELTRRGWA